MSEKERKARITTFNKSMTPEEAKREMELGTPTGEALKRAEKEYGERRGKK